MSELPVFDRRFLFITGKGGVGKTTITAAIARMLSQRGRRVLVCVCDSAIEMKRLFAAPRLNHTIADLAPMVSGVQLVPEEAFAEYAALILKNERIARRIFGSARLREFLVGVPGLKEWAMLGKAWYHATETEGGAARFDHVLFDAPATGHGLEMLRVPQVILDLAPAGPLRRDAEAAWEFLRDPGRAGVCVVTRAEELPTTEGLELCAELQQGLNLPIAAVVVNATLEALFSPEDRQALIRMAEPAPADPGDEALLFARRRAQHEQYQTKNLSRWAGVGAPVLRLPRLMGRAHGPTAIRALSENFRLE